MKKNLSLVSILAILLVSSPQLMGYEVSANRQSVIKKSVIKKSVEKAPESPMMLTTPSPPIDHSVRTGAATAERFCVYTTPSSNQNLPAPHLLSISPSQRNRLARALRAAFGGRDDDEPEEEPVCRDENYYETRAPDGNPCSALIEYFCRGELQRSETLVSGEGVLRYPSDCQSRDLSIKATCTSGSYDGYYAIATPFGWQSADPNNRSHGTATGLWQESDRRHVLYVGNDPLANNPDIEDGRLVIETVSSGGRPASSLIEIRRRGRVIGSVFAHGGEEGISLDEGEYEIKASMKGGIFTRSSLGCPMVTAFFDWYGTKVINVTGGRTGRYVVELDTRPVYTATAETTPLSVWEDPQKDFPQVAGEICDEGNNLVVTSGDLIVQGIDVPKYATFEVTDGKFTLYGLKQGRYLLKFNTGSKKMPREVVQMFKIPMRGFFKVD